MTLDELVKKYNGKQVEVAGSVNAQNQCVDLANLYIRDVLGLKIIEWTNAKDFPSKADDNYEYIKNTLDGVPSKGDLVIWNGNVGGGAGHISIFLEGNANIFTSFDQNWSVKERCKIEKHRYNNVIGWLRPIKEKEPMSDMYKNLDLSNKESMKVAVDVWHKVVVEGKMVDKKEAESSCDNKVAEVKKINKLEKENEKLVSDQAIEAKVAYWKEENKKLQTEISSLKEKVLSGGKGIKSRFTSRKFLLTAITALVPTVTAFSTLFGVSINTEQLGVSLTALVGLVLVFVAPEAYTDYKERINLSK